jgi:hypothetical protein
MYINRRLVKVVGSRLCGLGFWRARESMPQTRLGRSPVVPLAEQCRYWEGNFSSPCEPTLPSGIVGNYFSSSPDFVPQNPRILRWTEKRQVDV